MSKANVQMMGSCTPVDGEALSHACAVELGQGMLQFTEGTLTQYVVSELGTDVNNEREP